MKSVVFAAAGLLLLSACSGGHKEEEVLTDNTIEANVTEPETNVTEAPPAPVENVTNTASAAPAPEFTDEQQMRDDADASGLTARLPAEEGAQPAQSGNQAR